MLFRSSRVYHWTGSQWDDITGDAYDGAGNLVGSIGPDGTPSGTPLTQPAGQVCGQTMTLSPFLGAQGKGATDLLLTVSSSGPTYGSAVRITADTQHADATGAVTFTATPTGGAAVTIGSCDVPQASDPTTYAGKCYIDVSTLRVGEYAIDASYAGDSSYEASANAVAAQTVTVQPKALAAEVAISTRAYDGTQAASISSCSLVGTVGTDTVSCRFSAVGELAAATATFEDSNVGEGKSVAVDGLGLVGADASQYTLASTSLTSGTIQKASLTVTAADQSQVYDRTTFGDFTSTITGFVNGETESALRTAGSLAGTVTYGGPAATATTVGSTTITPVASGLTATN